MNYKLDLLCIGAHPDDCEIFVGGTMAKLTAAGYSVGILDLTRGEKGTRGTPEERAEEASRASSILGLCGRWNLGLPDAGIFNNQEQRMLLIEKLRELRPRLIISHWYGDRHPDHTQAHYLVRDVMHLAYVNGIKTEHERFRPQEVFWFTGFQGGEDRPPTIIIDITEVFEKKIEVLKAYVSQFSFSNYKGLPTFVGSEQFWDWIENRARYLGSIAGVKYAEAFLVNRPLLIRDAIELVMNNTIS